MRQEKKATLRWAESSGILQISHRCPTESLTKKKQKEMKSSRSKELLDPDPALAKRKTEIRVCVRRRRRRSRRPRCEVRAWCGAQRDAARLCPFLSIFFQVCPKPRSWTFFSINIQHQIQGPIVQFGTRYLENPTPGIISLCRQKWRSSIKEHVRKWR
jgi:hypothetical protein